MSSNNRIQVHFLNPLSIGGGGGGGRGVFHPEFFFLLLIFLFLSQFSPKLVAFSIIYAKLG